MGNCPGNTCGKCPIHSTDFMSFWIDILYCIILVLNGWNCTVGRGSIFFDPNQPPNSQNNCNVTHDPTSS